MRWLKALAALIAIVAVVGGIPAALVQYVGNPWPAEGVDLMAPLTDGVIVGLLAAAVWVLWAQLVACLVVEAIAAVRDRGEEISVPGVLGVQQQIARALVGAVVVAIASVPVLGATSSAMAAPPSSPAATTTIAQPQQQDDPVVVDEQENSTRADTPAESEQVKETADEPATVTVHRGDTLWSISEQHLGGGEQWRDLATANEGHQMTDGTVFQSSSLLMPGWELQLPTAAADAAPAGDYTVKAGDTLSQIALDKLGDATAYPDIVEASDSIEQPGGARLVDPDHIEPGWTLSVKGDTATAPEVQEPAAEAPQAPQEKSAPEQSAPQPAESQDAQEAAPGPQEQARPEVDADDSSADADSSDVLGVPVRTLGGIGALMAAGIVGLLTARRRRQQQRRQPGESIALPLPEARDLEVQLRSVADLDGPAAIDTLLRGLASHFAASGDPLPVVKLARWHQGRLELYLVDEVDLPAPWESMGGRAAWSSAAQVDQDADLSIAAPYPTLVTVGHDEDGGAVLVNLELVGPVGVQASATVEHQVLAAAAVELGTAPWATEISVVLVGAWAELVDVLEPGRARYVRAVEDYQPAAEQLEVLVLADEPDQYQGAALGELENLTAIIHPGSGREWQIDVAGNAAILRPVGMPIVPQLLTERDYQLIAAALGTAQQAPAEQDQPAVPPIFQAVVDEPVAPHVDEQLTPAVQPAGPVDGMSPESTTAVLEREATPDNDLVDVVEAESSVDAQPTDDQAADALLQTGHPVLRLLGRKVELVAAHGEEPTHVGVCLRMAAYLALNRGATKTQLVEAIWPAQRVTSNTVNPRVSQLRKWLGGDVDDVAYLPPRSLVLDERIVTDWDIFTGLVGRDVTAAATDDLEKALTLVEARPMSGHAPNEFPFAEFAAQEMIAGVVDAAYELARRRYMDGRWRDVEKAAALGVLYEPGTERLWRIWIHAAHSAGNPPAVTEAIERVHARISELGFDLEPETINLIKALEAKDTGAIEHTREAL